MAAVIEEISETLQRLIDSYPEHIAGCTTTHLIWKDGTKMPLKSPHSPYVDSEHKDKKKDNPDKKTDTEASVQDKLNNPTLADQLSVSYQPGRHFTLVQDQEPGRIRYIPFFLKMYGDKKEEVEKNLVSVPWLPKKFGNESKILVTKVNGVSEKIRKISEDLDNLPDELKEFLKDPGGTFCWRPIAGTNRMSAHSFGMTLDINVAHSHYWLWDYQKTNKAAQNEKDIDYQKFPRYQNKIPIEIVEIFEAQGFIWGGKWFHYDTMHFEYRPELFMPNSNKANPTKL